MIRSAFAILAGFVTTTLLAIGADALFKKLFPADFSQFGATYGMMTIVSLVYTAIFAIVGAWVTGRLAPNRPLKHALILGGIATAITVLASVAFWTTEPAWYHIIAIVMVLPATWIGGTLVQRRTAASHG